MEILKLTQSTKFSRHEYLKEMIMLHLMDYYMRNYKIYRRLAIKLKWMILE